MKTIEYGNKDADIVLVQPVDDHDLEFIESEIRLIGELSGKGPDGFRMIAVQIEDWNRDLSPWEAPPVFGKESFGSGAADTLEGILELCADPEKKYYIGGYSLAALFALWADYQTNAFDGIASASPSVWFPQFTDFMQENEIHTEAVYLSLGDREERTRNPVMSKVGAAIREANNLLATSGVDCELEWNKGNHFKDPDLRTAKAFAWLMNR